MPTNVTRAIFEYKYGPRDWRKDPVETFQETKRVHTQYTNVDGQLIRTVQTIKEFASALAQVGTNPIVGPPYLYADGNFYADPAQIMQTTRIISKKFESFSETSYQVTIDDFDVLLNIHTITHQVVDGKIPAAPTRRSALTSLVLRPLIGQLQHQCEWVSYSVPFDQPWAETPRQMSKAARRKQQRDSAIHRTITIPMNPYVKPGHTGRVVNASRLIDANHMVVGVKHMHSSETGKAVTELALEFWEV